MLTCARLYPLKKTHGSCSDNTLCIASMFANKAKFHSLSNLVCKVVCSVCERRPVWHCAVLSLSPYSASSISSHRLVDLRWLCRHTLQSTSHVQISPSLPVVACSTSDHSTHLCFSWQSKIFARVRQSKEECHPLATAHKLLFRCATANSVNLGRC